jgi:hypothetical protein
MIIESGKIYASLGWHVLPVRGKVPAGGSAWQNATTNDPDQVASVLVDCDGVGVQLGPKSGIVDVECDSEEAYDNLLRLMGGEVPQGVSFSSSRGNHYLFKWSPDFPFDKAVAKVDGIEFRIGTHKACQSVFPPSPGREWIVSPEATEVGEFPAMQELITRWNEINAPKKCEPIKNSLPQLISDKTDRAAKYLETIEPAVSGSGGHNATYRAACKMVLGFDLSVDEAFNLLASIYNPQCQPPWTEKELRRKCEQADKETGERGYLIVESLRFEHCSDVDLSGFCVPEFEPDRSELEIGRDVQDPGPFPDDCLLPPGFIADVARYTIATSNEPQPILALGGALCLLSVLTGRKIRNRRNNRTNLFVLGLGPSGCGKDRPREVNSDILTEIGSLDMIGPVSLGSGHGIESQLRAHPCRLFQLDEIGDLLKSIKKERGSGHMEAILQKIKMLMTSAHQVYSNSATSDIKAFFTINQPHLVIFGTATPEKFWNNLSVESIEDGFMGRLLPLEVVGYGDTQEPQDIEIPSSIIEQARAWASFSPGGSLASINPYPAVYDMTDEATARHKKYCRDIDRKIPKDGTHKKTDGLWKRARGRAASLALLFAASRVGPTETGTIDLCDVELAIKVINWITRKTIYKVLTQVHENQFEHNCNRVLDIIRKGQIDRSALSQKTRWLKLNERKEILQTLQDRGDISAIEVETKTNTRLEFRANF